MRVPRWILPALLAVPEAVWGQSAPPGWALIAGVDHIRFAAAAGTSEAALDPAVHLRPNGRTGIRVALQRGSRSWRVEVSLGWAGGNVEAANEAVAIRDRTVDLARYRLATGLERLLARPGGGELALALRPTLDLWSLDGENRPRAGAECGLALRLPLGAALVENRIAFGVSGSPLEPEDLDEEFETRPLRAVTLGVGLRMPL
jgi:hypothetical protein